MKRFLRSLAKCSSLTQVLQVVQDRSLAKTYVWHRSNFGDVGGSPSLMASSRSASVRPCGGRGASALPGCRQGCRTTPRSLPATDEQQMAEQLVEVQKNA